MRSMGLLACFACVGFLGGLTSHAFADLNVDALRSMEPADKLEVVKGLLAGRDAVLQNIRFSIEETSTNVTQADGSVRQMGFDTFEQRRLGAKKWMHLRTSFAAEFNAPGEDSYAVWDGKSNRTLSKPDRFPHQLGGIDDRPSSNFSFRAYNRMLGFGSAEGGPFTRQWLEAEGRRDGGVEVSVVSEGDRTFLQVVVTKGYVRRTLVLDPTRGAMPVRQEFRYEKGQNVNYESIVVDEANEIDGVWVPMKVTRRSGTSAVPGVDSLFVYVVKEFKFGGLTDDDFKLDFPPGTEVVDRVAKVAYRVLENGNVEMLPLLDSDTGRVLSAANPSFVDEAARELGVLATVGERPGPANSSGNGTVAKSPATLTPRRAGASIWIAAALGLCAIVTGVIILSRGRKSAAQRRRPA